MILQVLAKTRGARHHHETKPILCSLLAFQQLLLLLGPDQLFRGADFDWRIRLADFDQLIRLLDLDQLIRLLAAHWGDRKNQYGGSGVASVSASKWFNIHRDTPLGRLFQMCNPFANKFYVIPSANVFKLVCYTATLCSPQRSKARL